MSCCSEYTSRKIRVLSFLAMVTVVMIHSDPLSLTENPNAFIRRFSFVAGLLKLWAVPLLYAPKGD